ncbi:nickel pincer cofactor biosynthesis protein LarC [Halalkalicoccus sp. NIPERK01]|uniref:nickel pincer cofactor biosynthesis protein LarC n=1 Tax=Halalkalicoccus sp. NIPERK01 TaxID=3053469 RepID=UPI00256F63C5|nr:nickel pincer cofactor biosynthesis protein LarC [Halalkalicoccus sp. NIPERK01]MDL5362396.1 nickel pincer cofactor biosynthesis protein LarC [Halalkalicoccus sp. NIPERK01]
MRTLAFDGRTGASGDMILGALVAAGADPGVLAPIEAALGVRYEIRDVVRNGIGATSVDVVLAREGGERHANHDHDVDHGDHAHEREDHTDHAGHAHHHHDHADHTHAEGAGPNRSYREVCHLVESMDLDPDVEGSAIEVFTVLGEAEAEVHGEDLDSIHFHEVGADDAVADVVGTLVLLSDLDPDRIVTTPLSAGGGVVEMSHGTYPVPGPAVVAIAERADWSIRGGPVETELLTPTGAAILAVVAEGVETLPGLRVVASGYGAGDRELEDHPNVLRATVGDEEGMAREEITVLETNVDDVSPEVLGGLQETLTEAGARDVSILPATMKKSRPGHLVKVICRPPDAERVARRLAEETGTLGVRAVPGIHRWVASREIETVTLEIDGDAHEVDVKVASDASGEVYDASAEYDDAAAVARETGLAIREVLTRAEAAWHDLA